MMHMYSFYNNIIKASAPIFSAREMTRAIPAGFTWRVEETLKGKESVLPEGYGFSDKDGNLRNECRIRWWRDPASREKLKDVLIACPEEIADGKIQDNYYVYTNPKPVFFGHYWLKGIPRIENPNAVCLDYSVAKGGVLVACRLEEGMKLIF